MKEKILLMSRFPKTFTNKETGEVNEMLLITYAMYIDGDTNELKGYVPLECYTKISALEIVDKYIGKVVESEIKKIPIQNGFKYSLLSLNNEKIK